MLSNKFRYNLTDNKLYFEKKSLFKKSNIKIEMALNEINKVQFVPVIGLFRSRSGLYIHDKNNKITIGHGAVGSGKLSEYESFVIDFLKILRDKKKIKYLKGSYLTRFFMVVMFPFFLALFLFMLITQVDDLRNGRWSFHIHYLYNIVPISIIMFNYPKNFLDTKVKRYDPELIIKYGPKILFHKSYQKFVHKKSGEAIL